MKFRVVWWKTESEPSPVSDVSPEECGGRPSLGLPRHLVLTVVTGQLAAGVVHDHLLLQIDVCPVKPLVWLELLHSLTQLNVPRAPAVPGGSAAHPPGLTVGSHQSEKENINGSIQGGESRLVAS